MADSQEYEEKKMHLSERVLRAEQLRQVAVAAAEEVAVVTVDKYYLNI